MQLNRREFVALSVLGACACDASADEAPPAGKRVDAGEVGKFAEDGVYDHLRQSAKLIVFRNGKRLFAATARCTHKNCLVKATSRTELRCPCHGSLFDLEGIPVDGPAKTALFRYRIALQDGRVMIDLSRQFAEKDFEDPESFVQIEP